MNANKKAITVDLGASRLRVAFVDKSGKISHRAEEPTKKDDNSGLIISYQITNLVNKLIKKDSDPKNTKGIGLSVPGPVDTTLGEIINSPNIPYAKIPVLGPLKKAFHYPISFLNDCDAGVLGEKYFGCGKNHKNIVYITFSSGIGGGAIVNNHLVLGKSGNASQVGHFTVDTFYDFPCSCKKGSGHWEGYASGQNIPRFFSFWLKKEKKSIPKFDYSSAKNIFEAARKKEKIAKEFIEKLRFINGKGLSNTIIAYEPEVLSISGSVALHNQEFFIKNADKYIDKYLTLPRICISPLGEDSPLLGAAVPILFCPPELEN